MGLFGSDGFDPPTYDEIRTQRALSIAKIFAVVHMGDRDCLGKAARELIELVKDIPIAEDFDC